MDPHRRRGQRGEGRRLGEERQGEQRQGERRPAAQPEQGEQRQRERSQRLQLRGPGYGFHVRRVEQEEESARQGRASRNARSPKQRHEKDRDQGVQGDVDEVVSERRVGEDLALEGGEQQMHGRVVRGVELGGASGIQDRPHALGVELRRVGVAHQVADVVGEERPLQGRRVQQRRQRREGGEERSRPAGGPA
jgi:hypothetical protein